MGVIVKDLFCGYGDIVILKSINFELKDGEILGVIGPNGSGKTTLLRAITKVIHPKSGHIFINGKSINQLSLKELSRTISVVSQYQNIELLTNMTVMEFVLLGRIPYFRRLQFTETAKDEEIVADCMKLTETYELRDKYIHQISGGERQLAYIARALSQEPKILLLDEPTAHLDIGHQIKILDLLKKLNKERNITIFIILHDLNLASEYCDRLILLNRGMLYRAGPPEEVLQYSIIEEVYKTPVIVKENPLSSKPFVIFVTKEQLQKHLQEGAAQ